MVRRAKWKGFVKLSSIAVKSDRRKVADEFGDFQTPRSLALSACRVIEGLGFEPASIVEPNCGIGAFIRAATECFPNVREVVGLDINATYVRRTQDDFGNRLGVNARFICASFFDTDWQAVFESLAEPVLVIGNPPWVTNSDLGRAGSSNLPVKSNAFVRSGIEAITGKSNFDISEWMLTRLLHRLDGRTAVLAMLCKTSVARKTLIYAWERRLRLKASSMFVIDAKRHFDASVEACLLVCQLSPSGSSRDCAVYSTIASPNPHHVIGFRDRQLIADVDLYQRWGHLRGPETVKWRSGIKHDCSKVMELSPIGDRFRNGFGETVALEDDYLFPLLKSSDLASRPGGDPRRVMLVPQRSVSDDTAAIQDRAPKTWKYLEDHGSQLDRRASAIYRKRPRFAVFGIGNYSFAPWKVAISGFYKKLEFQVVGSVSGKPCVLDDTSYFVSCDTEAEARLLAGLLNSEAATGFFSAFVFWDAKRPITIDLLRRLDLRSVAQELKLDQELEPYLRLRPAIRHRAIADDAGETLFDGSQ